MSDDVETVRVTVVFSYDLPADPSRRQHIYGTVDAAECVMVDLANDPAAFMVEADYEVVSVSSGVAP